MSNKKDTKARIAEMKRRREEGEYNNPIFQEIEDTLVLESGKEIIEIPTNELYPAPSEWNFYPPLDDSKMLELIFSIMENGLFNAIILWEQNDGYMILAGHNRVEAYKTIEKEYDGVDGFNKEDFKKIPAIIYKKDEIDENKAREIIIDSNYIQREEDPSLTPTIIKERMDIVRNRKDFNGKTISVVAKEMGLSQTKVYEDNLIITRVIPEAREMYFSGELTKKAILRLAWFNEEMQEWILEEFKENLSSQMLMQLEKGYDKEFIRLVFEEFLTEPDTQNITIEVPIYLVDEFREMANIWIMTKKE